MIVSKGDGIRQEMKKKQRPSIKHSLDTFIFSWPVVDLKVQEDFLDKLLQALSGIKVRKEKCTEKPSTSSGSGLFVGLNEVTRNIKDIDMLFVCKEDCKPPILLYHIPLMCQKNKIHLVCLPRGASHRIGLSLGIRRATVIGSKENNVNYLPGAMLVDSYMDVNSVEINRSLTTSKRQDLQEKVKNYVDQHQGTSYISRVLIANNGIAAVKEIRSIRKWAYEIFGNERAIEFIVMATPEDIKANAEYIRMADECVQVPGGTNNNNHANVDLIVDIAERCRVHAVWAGWGHASENPRLPDMLGKTKTKIKFIGPDGNAMRSLGDKISSTIVAQYANVPTIPWSGSDVSECVESSDGRIVVDQETYLKACVTNDVDGLEVAKKIGFPVMIKASEGGGGKGIRKVESADQFANLFSLVQREVPGSPIFIMKLASNARHLEVQVIADQYGNAISIYGRDCSVQRRHQKIIEEAPVTIAPPEVFSIMEKSAVRLAKLVGYQSAGTVEYLYEPSSKKFFFLELNPRLQVEHPTTEMVSKVNIPAVQLQIAMGIPLYRISDIRRLFHKQPETADVIDFEVAERRPSKGHVIAARITAENPDAGFKPSGGKLIELTFRGNPDVWGYFSVGNSGGLHEYADSQFGHVFAYGKTRLAAKNNMIVALKELSIRGDFRTTVEYLVKLMETDEFIQNRFTTSWLDDLIARKFASERPETNSVIVCGSIVKTIIDQRLKLQDIKRLIEKGQIPPSNLVSIRHKCNFIYEDIQYIMEVIQCGPESFSVTVNKSSITTNVIQVADGGILISIGGANHVVYFKKESQSIRLNINGKTALIENDSDPSILRSPTPGKIVRFLVENGDHLSVGSAFAEVEVMKMYMPLLSTASGIVTLLKQNGCVVESGEAVATLKLDDVSQIKKAIQFEGKLDEIKNFNGGQKPHQILKLVYEKLFNVLDGYEAIDVDQNIACLFQILQNPQLPFYELSDLISSLRGRVNPKLEEFVLRELEKHQDEKVLPIQAMLDVINRQFSSPADNSSPIVNLLTQYRHGLKEFEIKRVSAFFEKFYNVEKVFEKSGFEDLREKSKENIFAAYELLLSHSKVKEKCCFLIKILDKIRQTSIDWKREILQLSQSLKCLTELHSSDCWDLIIKVKEILMYSQVPSFKEQLISMEEKFMAALEKSSHTQSIDEFFINDFISNQMTLLDPLPNFFHHVDKRLCFASLEIYVRRICSAYQLNSIKIFDDLVPSTLSWKFGAHSNSFASPANCLYAESAENSVDVIDSSLLDSRRKSHGRSSSISSEIKSTISSRYGIISALSSLDDLQANFAGIMEKFYASPIDKNPSNVLYIVIPKCNLEDEVIIKKFHSILNPRVFQMRSKGIKRVTLAVLRDICSSLRYFTFEESLGYEENSNIRHIEPAMAFHLELAKLGNYTLNLCYVDSNAQIHIYQGVCKSNPADKRLFIRLFIRPNQSMKQFNTMEHFGTEAVRILLNVFDAMDLVRSSYKCENNHLFINILPSFRNSNEEVVNVLRFLMNHCEKRFIKGRISEAEIKMNLQNDNQDLSRHRYFFNSQCGFVLRIEAYKEIKDPISGSWILESIDNAFVGPRHMELVNCFYEPIDKLQEKRLKAQNLNTTYVYDFPTLLEHSLRLFWEKWMTRNPTLQLPEKLLHVKELVLSSDKDEKNATLKLVSRAPGQNSCGMVAWLCRLFTPNFPEGRDVVFLANDINYEIGSFGLMEDKLFYEASKFARKLQIPRVYLSANSGARIGLSDDLRNVFDVEWKNELDHSKGFNYLTLPENDSSYAKYVLGTKEGSKFRITDIIGEKHGIGVENLQGSGMIAGETSKAYREIFTLTFVTCRSVGIGAYLVRLGQRVIQKANQPIILTGNNALNKVLGREVYSSNLQIGGPQIMHSNGVSHSIVQDDLEGINQIVEWISFVPSKTKALHIPLVTLMDPVEREISFYPPDGPYNPRHMLAGRSLESGEWESGFLDKDSFVETLSGWARTVVVGRGRLGGYPVGVIAVETRITEFVIPADPADHESSEQTVIQAGQVWYPDSSFKTAQAINDFNHGEELPLFIFANWRGFSGGQKDMFDQVLKFGSLIVDALKGYKQPIFIYIPPKGELRGGAWVVLDSSINPLMMEMYADPQSRGGILEPEGIAEIKYRKPHILATMERLDEKYRVLKKQSTISSDLLAEFKEYEAQIFPVYQQIALQFADLHDTAGRMKAKNVIHEIVEWKQARSYFYHRMVRRLKEMHLQNIYISELENFTKNHDAFADFAHKVLDEHLFLWLCSASCHENWKSVPDKIALSMLTDNWDALLVNLKQVIDRYKLNYFMSFMGDLSTSDKQEIVNYLK